MASNVMYAINFLKLSSNNLALLIICHVRKVVHNAFNQKRASSMKQTYLGDKLKNATNITCTSIVVLRPDPLSPTPSASSSLKAPEKTEVDPDDPEPADEGHILVVMPLNSCAAQVYEQ
jgi:hypothetical protein